MGICSRCFAVIAAALTAACHCPTVTGPTDPGARYSATLAPGELRYYDIDIPRDTTQINLQFQLDSLTVPLRVRQSDPSCLPAQDDNCESYYDAQTPPRPAGVYNFGNTIPPRGSRTRIVLQNQSSNETVTYSVTITPHQVGCT